MQKQLDMMVKRGRGAVLAGSKGKTPDRSSDSAKRKNALVGRGFVPMLRNATLRSLKTWKQLSGNLMKVMKNGCTKLILINEKAFISL
ncbi:hypothetical protein FACHB389_31800 [Nostoc calcicola FACHB-389]|nr:hypothetical protein FACHB389_31800 [Nostoc calcicola FACHB-389]